MKPLCAALLLSLAACASPSPVVSPQACPPVRQWSRTDLLGLADALAPIPENSPIWAEHYDWQQMRDELRACRNEGAK